MIHCDSLELRISLPLCLLLTEEDFIYQAFARSVKLMVRTSVPGQGVPLLASVVLMTWCHPAVWQTPMSVYRVNWENWTLHRVPKASRRRPKPVTRVKWPTVLTSESLPQQQVILSLGCVLCCISDHVIHCVHVVLYLLYQTSFFKFWAFFFICCIL